MRLSLRKEDPLLVSGVSSGLNGLLLFLFIRVKIKLQATAATPNWN
jgi:hypothetical protein